jgi:hypothetical protein
LCMFFSLSLYLSLSLSLSLSLYPSIAISKSESAIRHPGSVTRQFYHQVPQSAQSK